MRTDYTPVEEIARQRKWYLVDASEYSLGRLASKVATILRGKHKPNFAPHQDVGDFVVVINARKVRLTGNKLNQKTYFRHSGYPGGEKLIPIRRMLEKHPEYVIEHAVRLMLPKNALGRKMFKKLKVYPDSEHPHEAQQPEKINL
ncbi:MAG: 50S ribosomal protein L13 [Calditrichaeota bacterium]|nr:MAG: 50S ribosomal protein L13 [Calditrichota bacterium]